MVISFYFFKSTIKLIKIHIPIKNGKTEIGSKKYPITLNTIENINLKSISNFKYIFLFFIVIYFMRILHKSQYAIIA